MRLRDGLRYVASHSPAVRWAIVLVGIFGMFIISLPVTLAAFADTVLPHRRRRLRRCSTRPSPPGR